MQIECILDIKTMHIYLCICEISCFHTDEADYGMVKIFHHENKV